MPEDVVGAGKAPRPRVPGMGGGGATGLGAEFGVAPDDARATARAPPG